MAEQGWYDAGEVKPRNVASLPRCKECHDSEMWHPAHAWGPCIATLPGGEHCPCTAHLATLADVENGARAISHIEWKDRSAGDDDR